MQTKVFAAEHLVEWSGFEVEADWSEIVMFVRISDDVLASGQGADVLHIGHKRIVLASPTARVSVHEQMSVKEPLSSPNDVLMRHSLSLLA